MYEFSYNEVIEDSPQVMRAHERQAMDRVVELLRVARAKKPGARARSIGVTWRAFPPGCSRSRRTSAWTTSVPDVNTSRSMRPSTSS